MTFEVNKTLPVVLGLVLGLPLLTCGLFTTPTGPAVSWDPELLDRGTTVDCRARRWIPIQVPRDMELGEFLEAYRLQPSQRTFRKTPGLRGKNLSEDDVANHRGELWMAAGAPPLSGPQEEAGRSDSP